MLIMGNLDYFNVSVTQPVIPVFSTPESAKKREKDIQKLAENFMNDRSERNFSRLMNRCMWGLRSYVFDLVGDKEATDDIISKTMENIYFKWNTFKGGVAKFSTWMYNIAYINTISYFKFDSPYSNKIDTVPEDINDYYERSLFDDSSIDSDGDPYGYTDGIDFDMVFTNGTNCVVYTKEKVKSDIYDASVECIERLPDDFRIVMTERYINRKKVEDVANDNNLSLSLVKNRLRRARVMVNDDITTNYSDLCDLYKEYMQE